MTAPHARRMSSCSIKTATAYGSPLRVKPVRDENDNIIGGVETFSDDSFDITLQDPSFTISNAEFD